MGHAKDGGVWGHSSPIGANEYYIFAVGDQSLITEKAFQQWCNNVGINYKPLLGSYKGVAEHSYIIGAADIISVAVAGWLDKQESILHLDACDSRDRRKATLFYLQEGRGFNDPNKEPVELGVFCSVTKYEAMAQAGWTYDPMLNEYFICKDPDEVKLCTYGFEAASAEFHKKAGITNRSGNAALADAIIAYLKNRRTR